MNARHDSTIAAMFDALPSALNMARVASGIGAQGGARPRHAPSVPEPVAPAADAEPAPATGAARP
jgi:hypothetical protein